MIASASAMIRAINSLQVGMSWMSPATIPQLQAHRIHVAVLQDAAVPRSTDQMANIFDRRGRTLFALDSEDFLGRRICQHPLGEAKLL